MRRRSRTREKQRDRPSKRRADTARPKASKQRPQPRRARSSSRKGSRSGAKRQSKPSRRVARPRISKLPRLKDLSPHQLSDYLECLAVLADARRGYSFGFDSQGQFSRLPVRGVRHAANIRKVPFYKVERYVGSELFRDRKGRIRVTPADRLPRPMSIPTARGDESFVVRGSRKASLLADYRIAILTGDERELQKFKGKRVAGQELITDIRTIHALLDAGAVDPAEMYAAAQGGDAR